jgi:transcriptional regulator with XRE-family HTH domain
MFEGGDNMTNLGNKEIMAKNLAHYVTRSGKTQKEIAAIVGVAPSTFNDWLKAKKYPRIDKIEILADYFGILKSDLIEEKTQEHKDMQKNNDVIADIIVRMRSDDNFLSLVKVLNRLDSDKLSSLSAFLK